MSRWLLVAAAALVVSLIGWCAAPELATAQARRVVVESFRGPRAGRARDLLIASLEGAGFEIVSGSEVDAARRSLGLRGSLDDDEYVALARELSVIAFVDGRVSRARRSWRLTVRVRNAADGAILGSEGWGGRTTSALDGVGRTGAARLAQYLDAAGAPGAQLATTTQPRDDGETPWYERREPPADEEEPPPGDEDEDDEVRESPSDASGRYDSLRISLSGGAVWRSMQAQAEVYAIRRGGMPADPATATIEEQRGYTSSGIGHAELGVEGEFYPGAIDTQPFPYLGIVASFRHSVFLSSNACNRTSSSCEGDGRVTVGTDQLDLQAGLRARYRFGPSRRDFELFVEGLYGLSTFTFDLEALQQIDFPSIVPPMDYQYVAVGGGFTYGIVPDYFVVSARFDYRIGVAMGATTRNVWGIDTGPANGFLASLELRHEATWMAEGAFIALRAEYFQFETTFAGQVGCAAGPGGCPEVTPRYDDDSLWEIWPEDSMGVFGGVHDPVTDHYFRWGLYAGFAFR